MKKLIYFYQIVLNEKIKINKNLFLHWEKYKNISTKLAKPRVFIPVFPGTNCELDTARKFILAGAEVELVNIKGRENMLKEALAPLRKMYQYIIIDCPPSLGLLTLNALMASDSVITPVQCEFYAMEGLAHFMGTVHKIRQFLNSNLKLDGGVLTMYDARMNLSKQVLRK